MKIFLHICLYFTKNHPHQFFKVISKKRNLIRRLDTLILTHTISAPEVVVQRCSVKQMFLKISQNSQENTCVGFSFLIKLVSCELFCCEFLEVFMNTFFHRTSPLAASAAPISLLIKDKHYYYSSLILGVIELLVIQCQHRVSTDAPNLLEDFWNELIELSYLTCWHLFNIHVQKLMKLKPLVFLTKQLKSQISDIPDHVVIKWWSTNVTFKAKTQRSSRYFCVVLELKIWIKIWNKTFLKLVSKEGI